MSRETVPQAAELGSVEIESKPRFNVGLVLLALMLTIGAGVAVSYGLERDDTLWTVIGAVAFAPVAVASAHGAAGAVDESPRAAGAVAFGGLAIVFIVVIVVTTPWWGRDETASRGELSIAATEPSAHVYLHRTPGGRELSGRKAPAALVAGRAYQFACEVELTDSSRWLRLTDESLWVPALAMRTASGQVPKPLPTC